MNRHGHSFRRQSLLDNLQEIAEEQETTENPPSSSTDDAAAALLLFEGGSGDGPDDDNDLQNDMMDLDEADDDLMLPAIRGEGRTAVVTWNAEEVATTSDVPTWQALYGDESSSLDLETQRLATLMYGEDEQDADDYQYEYGHHSSPGMAPRVSFSSMTPGQAAAVRRRSSARSRQSGSDGSSFSLASAPARSGFDGYSSLDGEKLEAQRRVSVDQPGTAHSHRSSRRRTNLSIHPGLSASLSESTPFESTDDSSSGFMQSLRTRATAFSPRRPSRRQNNRAGPLVTASADGSNRLEFDAAVSRLTTQELGSADSNDYAVKVAAAAAVVASSEKADRERGTVLFGTDDHVLVLLALLNLTNQEGDSFMSTVDPVNKIGYPKGEGKTEAQKSGPFSYVLCVVHKVHFDEDERYYTVKRLDTGVEQRADRGWMEPIRDPAAIEVALRAAQRTERTTLEERGLPKSERNSGLDWLAHCCSHLWYAKLVPFYSSTRRRLKENVTYLIHGEEGYACKLKFTGVNLLVLCSFAYLFLELIAFAFLPAKFDRGVAIATFIVWVILLLELFFEILIRPPDYRRLIRSDRAFFPSTARHINRFHLITESVALLLFAPQLECAFGGQCGKATLLTSVDSSLDAVLGPDDWHAALGRFVLGMTFLRAFGLVRHWKQMWIANTFEGSKMENTFVKSLLMVDHESLLLNSRRRNEEDAATVTEEEDVGETHGRTSKGDGQHLKHAATIGTALMVVNSHRALFLLLFVVTVFPMFYTIGQQNEVAYGATSLLQANNLAANSTDSDDCSFLRQAVGAWLASFSTVQTKYALYSGDFASTYLFWARITPVRCDWLIETDGVITSCPSGETRFPACDVWSKIRPEAATDATPEYFAEVTGLRQGGIIEISHVNLDYPTSLGPDDFTVTAIFNENNTLAFTYEALFILMFTMLVLGLVGLTVMRGDAERLVLDPLQRMLKIVVRYAENPFSQAVARQQQNRSSTLEGGIERRSTGDGEDSGDRLGNYETEQLINAITKIADLLRKCWGVAGAGIISSNLAREKDGKTVVFNPTVPGKRVYALFGFVAVNDFSKLLRGLHNDVMILINDVANVVHEEVYRWAHGDSGQCNKNLGSAFLMVFRIGDFMEVHDKKKRATDVVFSSQAKRTVKVRNRRITAEARRRGSSRQLDIGSDGTLQLASLPGIQSFTDRALLGFLKSFSGIHRDKELKRWGNDFRLGAGVGNFTVSVTFGMDAGWAVEGAVGSEYKIDATYLSPHVNMASRMMSACKQYGVTILLSQAVEELLSKPARAKLRHLDTVYVKGSSVEQRIYTYDARFEGVDFFLFERSTEQADMEAKAYTPNIWETDQDLKAMRQHVSDEFMDKFRTGVEQYLEGDWKNAIETLQAADDMMIETVLEEGYLDYKCDDLRFDISDRRSTSEEIFRIRNEFGDGACKCLVQYMQRRNAVPPHDWHGVRHLMSK